MPRKAAAAVHNWIIAIAEDIIIEIAEIRRECGIRLLRHSDPFRTLEENQLRVLYPVGFYESPIPRRTSESGNGCPRRIIGGCGIVNRVSESCSEPSAVRPMLR